MKHIFGLTLLLGSSLALSVNLDSFQPIIEKVNSLQTTWKANTDFPSHLTISSFKRLLGLKKSGRRLAIREKHLISDYAIPEEFDSRKQWVNCPTISQIRDQGNCGSCWAVAAAAAFSDRLCIASNGSFTDPLSSEELLACCDSCGSGCNGGFDEAAWEFFSSNGLVTGGEYKTGIGCQPYAIEACEHHTEGDLPPCSSLPEGETPQCENKCTNSDYNVPFEEDHHKVHSAYSVSGVKEIQKEIMTQGPVEAGFSVYSDFPTYKSGVYKYTEGTVLGGHAVRIIGWGTENGTPYWLIANSWNTNWGDQGIFKILRGENECGIEDEINGGIPIVN